MLRCHCGLVSPGICFHTRAGTRSKQGGCTQMCATTRQESFVLWRFQPRHQLIYVLQSYEGTSPPIRKI